MSCGAQKLRAEKNSGERNIITLRSPHRSEQGREISKYYDRWRVQPFGPGIAIEHHAAVFARTGRFDSVVAKPKIEIIFFNGQRARLKSGLTKVSPMSPGRTFEFWWTRWDSNPRPPHCERGKIYDKARCHNHLDFLRASELPHSPHRRIKGFAVIQKG